MNKPLSTAELNEYMTTVKPFDDPLKPIQMTHRQKLQHWASLILKRKDPIAMLHGIEYMRWDELTEVKMADYAQLPNSIYGIAADDPKFQAAGLKAETLGDVIAFFELTRHDAHELSCDCHGHLSNAQMADRIEHLDHTSCFARIGSGAFFEIIRIT